MSNARFRAPSSDSSLTALLIGVALAISSCSTDREPSGLAELRSVASGKNVVMILLDAAAYGHFGYAGYERDTTPFIDALAAESLVFDNAYSPSASTGHTVYAMLTSTYPFLGEKQGLKGIQDAAWRVTEATNLMAELLAPQFDHRAAITGNPWFGPEFGLDRGFTHFYETYDNDAVPDSIKPYAGRTVDLFREDLAQWGEGSNFAYIHFLEPHTPYTPPDDFARKFDQVAVDSIDADARSLLQFRTAPPGPRQQEMIRALYDGNLSYVDAAVGEVIALLKQSGQWDDTIMLVIADHGEAFWQHGVYGHGRHIYEEFVRIPFVLRFPGQPQLSGQHMTQPVSLMDLLPTYLDLFDIAVPPEVKGNSLLPLIAGHPEDFETRLVFLRNTHGDVPEFGLRSGRYKWLYRVYEGSYQLYDLVDDPLEQNDLVAANRVPREAAPLREQIALWIATGTERVTPVEEMDVKTRERLRALGYF